MENPTAPFKHLPHQKLTSRWLTTKKLQNSKSQYLRIKFGLAVAFK